MFNGPQTCSRTLDNGEKVTRLKNDFTNPLLQRTEPWMNLLRNNRTQISKISYRLKVTFTFKYFTCLLRGLVSDMKFSATGEQNSNVETELF